MLSFFFRLIGGGAALYLVLAAGIALIDRWVPVNRKPLFNALLLAIVVTLYFGAAILPLLGGLR